MGHDKSSYILHPMSSALPLWSFPDSEKQLLSHDHFFSEYILSKHYINMQKQKVLESKNFTICGCYECVITTSVRLHITFRLSFTLYDFLPSICN